MLPPETVVFVLEDREVTQDSGCGAKIICRIPVYFQT